MKIIYLAKDHILINHNDRITQKELVYEDGIVTSTIPYKACININFKLVKPIEKEMLYLEAEKYLYTQGGLDYEKEYKIIFKFREYEEYYNVEAFVAEVNIIKDVFKDRLQVYKYIDFISAAPLVFQSYYDLTGAEPKNDMFVYVSFEDSFVSCFENGQFLHVKNLTSFANLSRMLDISEEELKKLFKERGLDRSRYANQELFEIINQFFSELFMKINNLVAYTTSNYNLEKIDNIYLYIPYEIRDLWTTYGKFWELAGISFQPYTIETDYDYFDYTALIYNTHHYKNEEENFSIFIKPIPIYKKKSFHLVLFALFIGLLLGGDYLFMQYAIKNIKIKIKQRERQIAEFKKKQQVLRAILAKEQEELQKLQQQREHYISSMKKILTKVDFLDKKNRYSFYNRFAVITELLRDNDLKIESFEKQGNHYTIIIKSTYNVSPNIASFVEGLHNKKYFTNISYNKILFVTNKKDKKKKYYVVRIDFDETT